MCTLLGISQPRAANRSGADPWGFPAAGPTIARPRHQPFRVLARRCGVDPAEDALAEACEARLKAQNELFVFRQDVLGALQGLNSAYDREDDWAGAEAASFSALISKIGAAGLSARSLLAQHQDRD